MQIASADFVFGVGVEEEASTHSDACFVVDLGKSTEEAIVDDDCFVVVVLAILVDTLAEDNNIHWKLLEPKLHIVVHIAAFAREFVEDSVDIAKMMVAEDTTSTGDSGVAVVVLAFGAVVEGADDTPDTGDMQLAVVVTVVVVLSGSTQGTDVVCPPFDKAFDTVDRAEDCMAYLVDDLDDVAASPASHRPLQKSRLFPHH